MGASPPTPAWFLPALRTICSGQFTRPARGHPLQQAAAGTRTSPPPSAQTSPRHPLSSWHRGGTWSPQGATTWLGDISYGLVAFPSLSCPKHSCMAWGSDWGLHHLETPSHQCCFQLLLNHSCGCGSGGRQD